MGSIYLIRHHKGDYEEYTMTNLCAFKSEATAKHHIERLNELFTKCYAFYDEKYYELKDQYPNMVKAPDTVFNMWYHYSQRKDMFYGVTFDIQQIEVRRFH